MFRRIARPLLAAVFVSSGVDTLRDPQPRAKQAAGLVKAAAERFGTPDDPLLAVRVNAGVMIAGGLGLATGAAPRTSAFALATSLVPTTVAAHPFWEAPSEDRGPERTQFLKNVGLLSALLLTLDTPYAQERAVRKAKKARKAEEAAASREKASAVAEKQAKAQEKAAAKMEKQAEKRQAKAEKAQAKLERRRGDDD